MISRSIKIAVLGLMSLVCQNVAGQDLIARQAPIDRKMRAIDSVAIQKMIASEDLSNPAGFLYSSWDNQFVSSYGNAELPEKMDIDLKGFCMPTTSRVLTSHFGPRWGRAHKGLDVKVYVGDTIRSAFSGKVRVVDYEGRGYGKYIVIRHNNGLETVYGHLSKHLVKVNDEVRAGDVIGLGGNTGRSTGSHLHFECRVLGHALDPQLLFNFPMQDVTCDVFTLHKSDIGRIVTPRKSKKSKSGGETVYAEGGQRYHKVHKGESLFSISRKYGMSVDELCRINGINKNSVLSIGRVLKCK